MAKRGAKPKPPHLKSVSGTDQPCRATESVFPALDGAASLPPDFEDLKAEKPKIAEKVLRTWNAKLATYNARGQSVVGCESTLYQYCLLEVSINELYRAGRDVPTAMVSQHRVYANEFYDTPASQVRPAGGGSGNKFGRNGKPPRRP